MSAALALTVSHGSSAAATSSQYLEGVKQHVAKEIYNIGDSFQAGLVWGATKAAYNLAQYI